MIQKKHRIKLLGPNSREKHTSKSDKKNIGLNFKQYNIIMRNNKREKKGQSMPNACTFIGKYATISKVCKN